MKTKIVLTGEIDINVPLELKYPVPNCDKSVLIQYL